MNTKYGELKNTSDLFEEVRKIRHETSVAGWDYYEDTEFKCKICGDILLEYRGPTITIGTPGPDILTRHIELHKTVNILQIRNE